MFQRKALVLAGSLFTTIACAAPGANTNGSTTSTVSASIGNAGECLLMSSVLRGDTDNGVNAGALADALAHINIAFNGDVSLDVTRNGKNGAVNEVNLSANMANGTLYALSTSTSADTDISNSTETSSKEYETFERIAEALVGTYIGVDESGDIAGVSITVKAGALVVTKANAEASVGSAGFSRAAASVDANSTASASGSVNNNSSTTTDTSVYVQATNIGKFQSQINLASGTLADIQTNTLSDTFMESIITSYAYALARASVKAHAEHKVTFSYDLPIIGSGTLPVITDFQTATKSAKKITESMKKIQTAAGAMATSTAKTLGNSSVDMRLVVKYENLPGLDDTLEASAAGDFALNCADAYTDAKAGAVSDSATNTSP